MEVNFSVVVTDDTSEVSAFRAVFSDSGEITGSDTAVLRSFSAALGESITLIEGSDVTVYMGAGKQAQFDLDKLRKVAANCSRHTLFPAVQGLDMRGVCAGLEVQAVGQAIAEGFILGGYRFDKYRSSTNDAAQIAEPNEVRIVWSETDLTELENGIRKGKTLANAVCLARDLINEPPSVMTPKRFGEIASEVAVECGLEIRIWDEDDAVRERLGGLLGVALGSDQPPRMIRLRYTPTSKVKARSKIALVGKGITFDSGGLSLKSADHMMTMKTDMSGAAAVLGAMSTLSEFAVDYEVTGYLALSENLPSGSAQKPGDVLTTRSGKTIEVLNTDAEGRLVLADALGLAVEDGAEKIVDLATLTGACVVALGKEIAGIMGNDDDLILQIISAGELAGEPYWRLPVPERYRKLIDSEVADMKNIGEGGGGALTAALLLKEFVGDTPWAHLDIAGPARSESDSGYLRKGAVGFGVRTLVMWLTS